MLTATPQAAGILAGIPASVALDEVADQDGERVKSLTNAQTADGVRLHVSLPVSVHDGEPAPVVIVIHQARKRAAESRAPWGTVAVPSLCALALGVLALTLLTPRSSSACASARRRFVANWRAWAACAPLNGYRPACADASAIPIPPPQVAIAPDVFQGKSTQWVPRALTLVGRATLGASGDWGAADLASVMRWVDAQPWGGPDCRLGVVGFCFGGGAALRFAEAHPGEVDAVASFYGAPLADAGRLNCPVFAAYGTADSQFPPAVVDGFEKHLSAAHVDATVLRYQGQPHAFVTDLAAIQAGGAPAEAWAAFLKFLRANALLPACPPVASSW